MQTSMVYQRSTWLGRVPSGADVRRFCRVHRDILAAIAAALSPAAVTVTLLPWRSGLPRTDVALALVAVVVAVAANGHRGAAMLAAVCAAVWFDFLWTIPYQHFTMAWPSTFVQSAGMLLIGAATGELAVRARRVRRARADDAACLAMIGDVRELAATGAPEQVMDHVESQLRALLRLRAARFEHGEMRRPSLKMDDRGELRWGDARWEIGVHGWPNHQFALPVRAEGRVIGHFMLDPMAGSAAAAAARQVAVVLADHVGAVLAGQGPKVS